MSTILPKENPTVEDFSSFLKDFEKFCEQYADDYEIDGAYFVVYEEYDKKTFGLLLKGIDEELRDYVKIKMLESPDLKSKELPTFGESKGAARKEIFVVHGREKTPALELARFIEKKYPIDAIFLEEET